MNTVELKAFIKKVTPALVSAEDQLRELDAALGDGDLGITVRSGAEAAARSAADFPADQPSAALLAVVGRAFASANPSTFSGLVGRGIMTASGAVADTETTGRSEVREFLVRLAEAISARGKSERGDKTVLDALWASVDALDALPEHESPTEAMADAAWNAVRESASFVSKCGRAAWVGERSAGHQDPGMTAFAILLDAAAGRAS